VATGCFGRLHPLVPGVQGVIYDTALRGAHHQVLLREHGLMPVNQVTAPWRGRTSLPATISRGGERFRTAPPHGHLALSVDKMASQFDAGRLAEALEGLQALTQDDPFDESDESGTVASWLW